MKIFIPSYLVDGPRKPFAPLSPVSPLIPVLKKRYKLNRILLDNFYDQFYFFK